MAFSGSARKDANIAMLVREVFAEPDIGEVGQDEEGMKTIGDLGRNMA